MITFPSGYHPYTLFFTHITLDNSMALSLAKGGRVSLAKIAPGLKTAKAVVGWTGRQTSGADFDLDISAFALDASGKCPSDNYMCFYGPKNRRILNNSIVYLGDERKGGTETILFTLDVSTLPNGEIPLTITDPNGIVETLTGKSLPGNVQRIPITVTMHEAEEHGLNFGMIDQAWIAILNGETGEEIVRFDLAEKASGETAMIMGEFYRYEGGLNFKAVGQGFDGGLAAMCSAFGIEVE